MGNARETKQTLLYPEGMGLKNDYVFEPGVCVLPVAGVPPADIDANTDWSPVVVLRLHAPYRLRKMNYVVPRKQNNPPVLPTPGNAGSFVFVGGTVNVVNYLNTSYQSFDWTAEANYVYVEDCVSRPQDGLVLGAPPFTSPVDQRYLDGGNKVPVPAYAGAVYTAGELAVAGCNSLTSEGVVNSGLWQYSNPSYFPGVLFNDYIANAGPPAAGRAQQ